MRATLASLFLVLFFPNLCRAHFIWFEDDCDTGNSPAACEVRLRFGEYPHVIETIATRLKEREGVVAHAVALDGSRTPLALTIKDDFYTGRVAEPGKLQALIASDEQNPVADWSKSRIGIVRPIFYTRIQFPRGGQSEVKPELPLDIIPLGEGRDGTLKVKDRAEFAIFFKGEPVAQRVEVRVYAPNGWSWEGTVENGKSFFTPEWPGLYIAEAILYEDTPGEFKGDAYQSIRHRATLSIVAK